MQIYIVPTYECNLSCSGCYSKKNKTDFDSYLSWVNFIQIYNKFKDECNKFAFIGGEPAKWKFINEAVLFLKNKGKKVIIFTNGTIPIYTKPTNVIVNGTNLFDLNIRNTIIEQIKAYKNQRVKITLRFNVHDSFSNENIKEAVEISKEYADSVSVSILFPVEFTKSLGNLVYSLCNQITLTGTKVRISRATPLCIFSSEQKIYLQTNCKLSGQCSLPNNSIVILPDGKTIQPCVELNIYKSLKELTSSSPRNLFFNEINNLKSKENPACSGCELFITKQCCGGCLSYK